MSRVRRADMTTPESRISPRGHRRTGSGRHHTPHCTPQATTVKKPYDSAIPPTFGFFRGPGCRLDPPENPKVGQSAGPGGLAVERAVEQRRQHAAEPGERPRAGVRADQEPAPVDPVDDGAGHVLRRQRLDRAADRARLGRLPLVLLGELRSVDVRRVDDADVQAVRFQLGAQRLHQPAHRELRRPVRRVPVDADEPGRRRHRDDTPPAALDHAGRHRTQRVQRAEVVDLDHLPEHVVGQFEEPARAGEAGAADEDVARACFGAEVGDGVGQGNLVGDVDSPRVHGAGDAGGGVGQPLLAAGDERDRGAAFSQQARDAQTDAAGSAGDDRMGATQLDRSYLSPHSASCGFAVQGRN